MKKFLTAYSQYFQYNIFKNEYLNKTLTKTSQKNKICYIKESATVKIPNIGIIQYKKLCVSTQSFTEWNGITKPTTPGETRTKAIECLRLLKHQKGKHKVQSIRVMRLQCWMS